MAVLHGWRLCPRCGAELELARSPLSVSCPACGFAAYANPVPAANALLVDASGRLLLARRSRDPARGLWDAPGGVVGEGEHPLDTVRRELREEAGLEIEPDGLAGMWVDRYGDAPDAPSTLGLYWHARVAGGELAPADDVAELAWFAPDELPGRDELAFPSVAAALAAWREGR
jgi:ADP-ribose pyrophosphatase YjhB (NUDIX family)